LAVATGKDALFDDAYGLLGAIQKAGLAACTDRRIYMGLRKLFLLKFFGRAVPLGVNDGSPWAGVKAGATFLTEIGVYVKADFDFPFNGLFGTPFGTGATSGTIVTDAVGHGENY
jgi:hypothetical protein